MLAYKIVYSIYGTNKLARLCIFTSELWCTQRNLASLTSEHSNTPTPSFYRLDFYLHERICFLFVFHIPYLDPRCSLWPPSWPPRAFRSPTPPVWWFRWPCTMEERAVGPITSVFLYGVLFCLCRMFELYMLSTRLDSEKSCNVLRSRFLWKQRCAVKERDQKIIRSSVPIFKVE